MLDLDKRSIMYLPGVGPKKAEILQKEAGISSYEDMLTVVVSTRWQK